MKRIAFSIVFLVACFISTSAVPQRAFMDFDGDNKTDYIVRRTIGGNFTFYIQRSTAGFSSQAWGIENSDFLAPGDYDGDLKWDIAIWRLGQTSAFYILQSQTNTLRVVPFGQLGDYAGVSQDFDGDGKCDPAVVRTVNGVKTWVVLR